MGYARDIWLNYESRLTIQINVFYVCNVGKLQERGYL
jgi:hypothetical protein